MGAWDQEPLAAQNQLNQAQTKPKILIGIPHESKCYFEWAYKSFSQVLTGVSWCDKAHQFGRGVPLGVARDQIVESMLGDPSITHILWVDTDMICTDPPDLNVAMKMLYDCNAPIVSGIYRAKQKEGFNYAMWMNVGQQGKMGFTPIESWTGNWLSVDTVGLGFCLIKREVYENCPRPWHVWDKPAPSEDFYACILFRQYNYVINVFTDVKLRHLGEMGVNIDGSISTLEV